MKNHSLPARRTLLAVIACTTGALGIFAGCSKSDREDAKDTMKSAYTETKDAMSDAWAKAKAYTFADRDQFAAQAKAMSAQMDAQVSQLQAKASDAQADASRKAAWQELKDSEANYKEKVSALGAATADTWDSAKDNTVAAWDRLQAAYYKARAD